MHAAQVHNKTKNLLVDMLQLALRMLMHNGQVESCSIVDWLTAYAKRLACHCTRQNKGAV
jgi:hypothetical protein